MNPKEFTQVILIGWRTMFATTIVWWLLDTFAQATRKLQGGSEQTAVTVMAVLGMLMIPWTIFLRSPLPMKNWFAMCAGCCLWWMISGPGVAWVLAVLLTIGFCMELLVSVVIPLFFLRVDRRKLPNNPSDEDDNYLPWGP